MATATRNVASPAPPATPTGVTGPLQAPPRGRWVGALAGNLKGAVGALILLLVMAGAATAPLISPIDPNRQVLQDRLKPPLTVGVSGVMHVLGTDHLGRDVLSRILYGARVSLIVGLAAVALAGTIGISLGLISGYLGGFADDFIMRLADMQLALPFILIATVIAAILGSSELPSTVRVLGVAFSPSTVLVLGVISWVAYARVVRAGTLSVREREYVLAARALGLGWPRIVRRYVLPNVTSPVLVVATFAVAQMILAEAALAFLGLGTPVNIPSWGGMLSEARNYITVAWWTATLPGLAITITVIGINLFGDWMRDYLDPRSQGLV